MSYIRILGTFEQNEVCGSQVVDHPRSKVLRQLSFRNLAQAARLQWSWSHTSSLLVGAAIAWKDGFLNLPLLFLSWFCVEMLHAATCMTNDYWDYRSGADAVGEHTIFNAGSRVIQDGKISPSLLVIVSLVCYVLGGVTGIYLVVTRGWPLLLFGIIGVALGYSYTAPPREALLPRARSTYRSHLLRPADRAVRLLCSGAEVHVRGLPRRHNLRRHRFHDSLRERFPRYGI